MLPFPNSATPSPQGTPRLSITSLANTISNVTKRLDPTSASNSPSLDDPSSKGTKHRRRGSLLLKLPFIPPQVKAFLAQYEAFVTPVATIFLFFVIYFLLLSSPSQSSSSTSKVTDEERSNNLLLKSLKKSTKVLRYGFGRRRDSAEPDKPHQRLNWQPQHSVINWGDHVGLGRARKTVLDHTPTTYNDLTDRVELKGLGEEPWFRKRRSELDSKDRKEWDEIMSDSGRKIVRQDDGSGGGGLGEERRGIMGGGSIEWSTGVLGSGIYLGPGVDMIKKGGAPASKISKRAEIYETDDDDVDEDVDDEDEDEDDEETKKLKAARAALFAEEAAMTPEEREEAAGIQEVMDALKPDTPHEALERHILTHAWEYIDDEDRENTDKLMRDARQKSFMDELPLRDRVRDDEKGMKDAAAQWSRIYAATDGQRVKSALEVQLEKTVRRVPIVVFSQIDCTRCKWAVGYLKELNLSPEPYVVMVDERPDQNTLTALLARRTQYEGYPNIVIGGRSIGGAADLEYLAKKKKLAAILDDSSISHNLGRSKKKPRKKKNIGDRR